MTELDYESIENAVMETARGRWFLSEHKKRHSGTASTDTPALLEAIGRLEKVISSISPDFAAPRENKAQSEQPKAPEFTPAVVATPDDFAKPPKTDTTEFVTPESPQLSEENLQFFANDEDLFADDANALLPDAIETADATAPDDVNQPVTEAEISDTRQEIVQDPAPANERFKIFKASEKPDNPESEALADPEQASHEAESTNVPDVALQPTSDEQDRIVVIRKSADSDIDIPLADDFEDALSKQEEAPAAS